MNETQNLEMHLQQLIRNQGSTSDLAVTYISGDSLSAYIDLVTKEIKFQIPDGWNLLQYEQIKIFAEKLRLKNPQLKVCEDIAFHEVGHNRLKDDAHGLGCPEDVVGKEMAVEAVSKALLEANRFSPNGALYLENCISDIINNLNCSQYTHLNGLSMFLAEQGELSSNPNKIDVRQYSPLYEAFVKLNQQLWGRKKQKQMLIKYYSDNEKVDEVVSACFQETGLTKNKDDNLQILFDKQKWSQTFYTFAKHLVKLMDQNCPEYLPGSGNDGKGYKVPAEFNPNAKFDPEKIDDPLMKKVLDNDNMKKVMQRRNESGEDLPSFVENWWALDYFYQAEASEIWIKAETLRKGESMPIAPIQARIFDAEKDTLEKILFGRILLDEKGDVCFAVPRDYLEQTIKYKQSVQSYPELNVAVLDNSVSMTLNNDNEYEDGQPINNGRTNVVPWGDQSKYHYAVLTYYGIEKALHRLGVATKTKYNLVTFSSKTEATGEKDYEDRTEMKKRILNPTFGRSTNLNIDVLAKQTRQKGSVLMTISDGEIQNWGSIKDQFKQTIADKFYVHFQIGAETQTTRDLKDWGAVVVDINNVSEMPKKAIDITKGFYQSYAGGDLK